MQLVIWIVNNSLGKRTRKFLPLYGTMIIIMLLSNLSSLLGVQAPTSNLSVNATLAVIMFCVIQFTAFKEQGILGHLKGWTEPIWILTPLNILGDCVFPLSLSLRLFGNMLGGTIIMTLIYSLFAVLHHFYICILTFSQDAFRLTSFSLYQPFSWDRLSRKKTKSYRRNTKWLSLMNFSLPVWQF